MRLEEVIEKIGNSIKSGALPGADAQYLMSSMGRKSSVFNTFGTKEHKKSAVLILLYEKNGQIAFPLMQRHTYKGVHSGQVSLPGGKFEENDRDLSQTALRETEEEIGVSQNKIQLIGQLTDLYIPPSNHHVHPFVGYVKHEPKMVKDDYEVAELFETNLSLLLNESIVGQTKVEVANGLKIKTPYFDINNKVVWGATAMILSELKQVLRGM